MNTDVETIVAIRHGEEISGSPGSLTRRGFNRALALPNVLIPKYGTPNYIFAPNPEEPATGAAGKLHYILRPFVTIEPTAIHCQVPVNITFNNRQFDQLAGELKKPDYQNALVFVAWEHNSLDKFAQLMIKSYGGDSAQVPQWAEDDFDTIFVFKITHQKGGDTLTFTVDHEGLNNLSDTSP